MAQAFCPRSLSTTTAQLPLPIQWNVGKRSGERGQKDLNSRSDENTQEEDATFPDLLFNSANYAVIRLTSTVLIGTDRALNPSR